jgi:hypothetical protein
MRRGLIAVVALGAVVILGLVAAALLRDEADAGATRRVDERSGSYRGVTLGETEAEVRDALGPAPSWTEDDSIAPLDEDWLDIGAPNHIPSTGSPGTMRYPHVSVLLDDGRVTAIVIAETEAESLGGVGVGDDLGDVRRAYPGLRCGEAAAGDAGATFPYCAGRVGAKRWLRFGKDPVESITIASLKLSN